MRKMALRLDLNRLAATVACVLLWSCGSGPGAGPPNQNIPTCTAKPADGLLATFNQSGQHSDGSIENDYYWVSITNAEGIQHALDTWNGKAHFNIPAGLIECESADWNCGWSWHLDPSTVTLAEVAVELCDGGPPTSRDACLAFRRNTNGSFCPWGARLVELRDCRNDKNCPLIPR